MSTRTIYKYFDSKEDLLFSIIDERLVELAGLMRIHIGGLKSTSEIFRKLFWVTMDFFDRNPDLAVTAFITVPLKSFMESGVYRRESELDIISEVVTLAKQKRGVDPDIADYYFTDFYFMICHRHIHNWYFNGMKWSLADEVDHFFDFFWRVVEPDGGNHVGNN